MDNYYRFIKLTTKRENQQYRDPYRRDYARVLHSPSFRRLDRKTQLFPGGESDFFRTRLTHSLEVAQIAKSIALKIKLDHPEAVVEPDVCEIAGMIHDIGHPPFGHNGEYALDECMLSFGGFEGNAQTLRIITRLEKREQPDELVSDEKDNRVGLNLTARVIASSLKYDKVIPLSRRNHISVQKGYYQSELDIVRKVKECLIGDAEYKGFKTIECQIMDLADDIAYSTYDMEDAFKAEFLTPYDILSADDMIYEQVVEKMKKDNINTTVSECREILLRLFSESLPTTISNPHDSSKPNKKAEKIEYLKGSLSAYHDSLLLAKDGYRRTDFTSRLVNEYINGINYKHNLQYPILSTVTFNPSTKKRVNIMKHFAYVCLISSSRLKVAENRGKEIISKMFHRLDETDGYRLLPEDFQQLYLLKNDDMWHARVICDFISGMTDRYAMEFYGRLFSENAQTIFKPL